MLKEFKVENFEVNGHRTLRFTCPRCNQRFIVSRKIVKINEFGTCPCPYCYSTAYFKDGLYEKRNKKLTPNKTNKGSEWLRHTPS